MKRGAALLLIICFVLILPGIILGAKDKPFHLFWDMPFGLKVEDCLERVKQEQALSLTKIKSEDGVHMALVSSRKQNIEYFSYPVDIALNFVSRIYTGASVYFRFDEAYIATPLDEFTNEQMDAHLQKSIDVFTSLLQDVKATYGNSDGKLTVTNNNSQETFDFPMNNTTPDTDALRQLLSSSEDAILSVAFNNVSLNIQRDPLCNESKIEYMIHLYYQGDA